jgi:hypothetical protein
MELKNFILASIKFYFSINKPKKKKKIKEKRKTKSN